MICEDEDDAMKQQHKSIRTGKGQLFLIDSLGAIWVKNSGYQTFVWSTQEQGSHCIGVSFYERNERGSENF